MAGYTTPRTWSDGELVTASIMNTHIRDNEVFMKEGVGRVASDITVTSSTSYVDVTGISFSIAANDIWAAEVFCTVTVGGTPDVKFTWAVPSGATGHAMSQFTEPLSGNRVAIASDMILGTTTDADYTGFISILVVNSTNAGTVQLRFAQNTSSATSDVFRANSFIVAHRIA